MSGSGRTVRGLVFAAVLGTLAGVLPASGQTPTGVGRSLSLGSIDRLDMTRPAVQAQLMEERNATLLSTGVVDPETYILGPGDIMGLEVPGAVSLSAEDIIGADGSITFPQVGTFRFGGMTLAQARKVLLSKSDRFLRGGRPELLLKTTRTFKVHVAGKVQNPGPVPASATTRVSEAIQGAGGFRIFADTRNIRVTHADGSMESADLMPFLLAGDLDGNPILRDGDIIFVPPRVATVEFRGAFLYPGRYDYVDGEELGAMLHFVQLLDRADRSHAIIQRFRDGVHWDTLSVDLSGVLTGEVQVPLRKRDRVLVRQIGDWHTGSIATVQGAVKFPGPIPVRRGVVRVATAIRMAGGYLDDAVPRRIILGRPFLPDSTMVQDPNSQRNFVQSLTTQRLHEMVVDLSEGEGPVVEPGDLITVPRMEDWIEVLGQVKHPGFYNYQPDWKIPDYVEAAGGWAAHADKSKTRLSRSRYGDVAYARDVEQPAPGDMIWVPERQPHTFWGFVKDFVSVGSQAFALVLVIQQALK